jgi:hypothetical protein
VTQLAELLILASQGSLAYEREPDRLIAGQRGQQYDHRARCQWLPAAPPPGPSDARQLPVTVAAARRRRLRAQHPRGRLDPGPPQHSLAAGAIPPWRRALGLEPNATPEFLTPPGQVAFTHVIGIPVYVRAAHGGAPRGTDRGIDQH